MPLRLLIVDDEPELRASVSEALRDAGHAITEASDGGDALAQMRSRVFDAVLTDINLPVVDGVSLLRRVRAEAPSTKVILMTAYGDIAGAVSALKEGAYDYLAKPFDMEELMTRLRHVADEVALQAELEHARAALAGQSPETLLIGQSPPIVRLLEMVRMVAGTDAAALITGESGTGKELVARLIHDRGPRCDKPFVPVNCGALTETLIEAELFGHEKGAFTGAERRRDGRFKAADGGTIFLDEVAELPLSAQAKLLRVLQEGTFQPLGTNTTIKVDVRIVSATHRTLRERVRQNLFREDLFYRINVIEVAIPPLRDRPGDIAILVEHFLQRFARKGQPLPHLTPAAWAALSRHPFPGNVRELSHAIQHAVVLSSGTTIGPEHLPMSFADEAVAAEKPKETPRVPVKPLALAARAFERDCLVEAMDQAGGDPVKAAALLDLSSKVLWGKLKLHGLDTGSASVASGAVSTRRSS